MKAETSTGLLSNNKICTASLSEIQVVCNGDVHVLDLFHIFTPSGFLKYCASEKKFFASFVSSEEKVLRVSASSTYKKSTHLLPLKKNMNFVDLELQ